MKCLKPVAMLMAVFLLTSLFVPAHAAPLSYTLGDTIQDFTFTTYDGQEHQFSDVLKDKEAVLINIWATWCGPCRSEFPHMQEAYEKYQDKVAVIALSSESTDTPEVLSDFAAQYGLTFMIGQDPVDYLTALQIGSIPTTLMVDRFGTICLIQTGAQPNVESFERMFDAFLGDEYTESVIYRGLPSAKPNVAPAAEEEITAALGANAFNPGNTYSWPMLPVEKDGRNVVTASNAGHASSEATISAVVDAKQGDAIVVTFKTSTEQIFDLFKISVNGQMVKVFSGEHDWMTYAIPVEEDGEYTIKLSYQKDNQGDSGSDTVWIDSISVAEDAAAALAANPKYPATAEKLAVFAADAAAKEIVIEDVSGLLKATFGDVRCFITNADQANVSAVLTTNEDPEAAFLYTSQGMILPLTDCIQEDVYQTDVQVDSAHTTGYACTSVLLYPDSTSNEYVSALLFRDEENVNLLCEYNNLGNWEYVSPEQNLNLTASLPAQVDYVVNCVDQEGNPVSGVMVQVCDEATCQVFVSDANGQCVFTAAPKAWEVHILMAPEGYSAGENNITLTAVEGGEITLMLSKQ